MIPLLRLKYYGKVQLSDIQLWRQISSAKQCNGLKRVGLPSAEETSREIAWKDRMNGLQKLDTWNCRFTTQGKVKSKNPIIQFAKPDMTLYMLLESQLQSTGPFATKDAKCVSAGMTLFWQKELAEMLQY